MRKQVEWTEQQQHYSKVTTSEEEEDEESIVRVTRNVKSRDKEGRGPVYVYEEEAGVPRMAGTTSGTYISNGSDWVKSTAWKSPPHS